MTLPENYLYNFVYEEKQKYLQRIDFDNNKEIIFDLSDYYNGSITTIHGYGDYLYFDAVWFEDESQSKLISRLYRYNMTTNEIEMVLDDFICNGYQMIDDTTILYMDLSYNILKLDIKTGKSEILYQSTGNYGAFSYDGMYLYVKDFSKSNADIYDLDGALIDTIEVPSGDCLFGDSEYLFISNVLESDDSVVDESEVFWYVLPKSQIGNSEKEYIKLNHQ